MKEKIQNSVKDHRKGAGMTQEALAGAIGVCAGLAALALGGSGAPGPIGIRTWIVLLTLVGAGLATGPPLGRVLRA